ncbi:MAG: stage III sporulation protein AE [Oscillospiraceae bacterium]|jgi:stage III sporulation protein AE
MKRLMVGLMLLLLLFPLPAWAEESEPNLEEQLQAQLDALGGDELLRRVPEEAREYLQEADLFEISLSQLMELTPGKFFPALGRMFWNTVKRPSRTLAAMLAVIMLCALLESLRDTVSEPALSGAFQTVSVLCILTAVATPILDCIVRTTNTIQQAAFFMLSFIPMFSAAMVSAGQPATGAAYNLFLLSACQVVSQVVAQTFIPMMAIYLAFCICGSFVPELNVASAASGIRNIVSWAMGLMLTVFVSLLSIQSMLSHGADGVGVKATKFLINSLVPAVGNILSDAYIAAQGCLRLLKTTVGAYGIVVALFTFLPTFLYVAVWYLITRVVSLAGDIVGADRVSGILKACSNVLGLLIAAIFCFALLIIISTSVVMITGLGGAG